LGGPNFHVLPVNRSLASVHNNQRDGFGRQSVPKGRIAYEPNSLGGGCPFMAGMKDRSYVHHAERLEGHKVRARSESFSDHFSQAQLFFKSQSQPEKNHIRDAFIFELSKVESATVKERMLQTLLFVDRGLAKSIADALKIKLPKSLSEMPSPAQPKNNIVPPNPSQVVAHKEDEKISARTVPLPEISHALSMVHPERKNVETRKIALLVTSESIFKDIKAVRSGLESKGIFVEFVGPSSSALEVNGGKINPEKNIASTPSVAYDGVIAMTSDGGYENPEDLGKALKFIGQSYKHCKTIGAMGGGVKLLKRATFDLISK
jgi:catalase